MGFYADIHASQTVVLSERPGGGEQAEESAVGFDEYVQEVVTQVNKQWTECYRISHRARIFRSVAIGTLIVSWSILSVNPAMFVVDRILMIRWNLWAFDLIFVTICLKYATVVDYASCLCQLNRRKQALQESSDVFTVELHRVTERTLLFASNMLFFGCPLYMIGLDLILFDSHDL
ncbi:unnamed protein product [Echinostoma caproni]|uniref:Uncharacterized protein n=1 Tax=Echinostoma caproni TaxID=27848 RepID=A0A3P8GWI1_9TREM|nr:unnamed protein product [Echinostoma caproni]